MSAREDHAPRGGRGVKAGAKRPKCPICGKPRVQEFRPFCSRHCADVDLGRWFEGRYAVPGEPLGKEESDQDEER